MDTKKNIGLIVLIVIMSLLVLGLGGYFVYSKLNSNASNSLDNKFTEFTIVEIFEDNSQYLLGKKNGNWEEILTVQEIGYFSKVLGFYNNKLYFYNEQGLAYIDFDDSELIRKSWIDYPEIERDPNEEYYPDDRISEAILINDTIYFEYNSSGTGGIQSLKLSNNSLDDAKSVLNADLGSWQVDKNKQMIFYIEEVPATNGPLYSFDITNGTKKLLFNNVVSFKVSDNKILYYVINQSKTQDANGYYPAVYDLYLYDVNTENNQKIFTCDLSNIKSGNLWSFAEYKNNDIYYKDGNNVIKYNNGKKDIIYTWSANSGGDKFYGFYFITKDIIELIMSPSTHKYLYNGNIQDKMPENSNVSVKMSNGSTKIFSQKYFKDIYLAN